jgi:hypothetical protein
MSIIDFTKTGDLFRKNQADIAIVIGFVLVAIIAFGAGRLSAPQLDKNAVIIEQPNASSSAVNLYGNVSQSAINSVGSGSAIKTSLAPAGQAEGMFVASRGGTKYHWPWCSYGEKIKEANKIWFNSETEAQAAGYSPCACIQSKAPAGYVKP